MTGPNANRQQGPSRRQFLLRAGATATGFALAQGLVDGRLQASATTPGTAPVASRIGIIGSGNIGGAVGLRWAKAGHQILFSSRHPEDLGELVEQAGAGARAGLPGEAAEFGEIVLIAVPYAALPQVGRDYASAIQGKVVIDCGNPYPGRDGPMADDALARGTGVASAEYLPGVRLVRAFNAINYRSVESEANREGEKVGIPIAGDDREAVSIVSDLVVDAGFDPVVVGGLQRAREFDQGSPVYVTNMTAAELQEALGLR
jgi:predicted dinucleotide-binding enzyme